MILNKKGLMMLPLVALLFTSCSPWKGVDYKTAKEFIDTNYKLDGATAKLPTKVHEKFNATAADEASASYVFGTAMLYFYSMTTMLSLEWSETAPYKCDYDKDYEPKDLADPKLLPIVSGGFSLLATDYLYESDVEAGYTVTYQTNGKKFKQNLSGQDGPMKMNQSITYNDEGYRLEVSGSCSANGEITDEESGQKMKIDFSFTFSGTYTY